jgi:hypothetical protein
VDNVFPRDFMWLMRLNVNGLFFWLVLIRVNLRYSELINLVMGGTKEI